MDLPRFPSISPDGSEIVFSWRGDLWKVAAHGGYALRLTSHPADETNSTWSRDGSHIAFNSNRDGYRNIYMMKADGTNVRQVSNTDRGCTLYGFGVDEVGKEVVSCESFLEGDVYRAGRPYMVHVDGGELQRIHDAFGGSPVISPDGARVVFTRGGYYDGWSRRHYRGAESQNIWVYDRRDDSFTQLTDRRGHDGKPRWGGHGEARTILYLSDRELDTVNLYRMSAAEGEATSARITSFEGRDVHDFDVSADGSMAVLMVWDTLYTLDLDDPAAEPQPLTVIGVEDDRDNYEWRSIGREVSEAALSPDGKVMAFIAYGRVYVRNVEEKSPTRRVSPSGHARHQDLAWAPDGEWLYFVSDESGTDSIYAATVTLTRSEVKEAYENALAPVVEEPVEPEPQPDEEDDALNDADDEDAAAADDDDSDATDAADDEEEEDEEEAGDDEEDVEASSPAERWHDALAFAIEPVIQSAENDRNPSPSPDGKSIAFRRGRGDLMIFEIATGEVRRLVEGWDSGLHWRWSADSAHIAYAQNDLDFNMDIFITPADGSTAPVNVSRHPRNDHSPAWSHDGRILSFVSNRIGGEYDLWMVYLDKTLEGLTPKELDAYYEEAVKRVKQLKPLGAKSGKKQGSANKAKAGQDIHDRPARLDLDDAYLRLHQVTRYGGVSNTQMTPAGDRYLFVATVGESRGLHSVKWDGSDRKRLSGNVNVQHLSLQGDKVVYVSGGRGGMTGSGGGSEEFIDISDTLRIDLQEQSGQKFLEAARFIGENFYHHDLKGLDWERITQDYFALARQTRTADEFNYVANRFIGELNGSHLGIRAPDPDSPSGQARGRLGIVHRQVPRNGGAIGMEVVEIVPDGPAATSATPLEVGDVITAIDFEQFGRGQTLEEALLNTIGREVVVTVERVLDDGRTLTLDALLIPISYRQEASLKYDAWVKRNRALVDEWSAGRVGYIHIQGMNQPSLDRYERDLHAAAGGKDGLIIDVRNNGGGWTTDRLLASIMVQPHAYTIPRGADSSATGHYPQDRLFIQRYTQPINMLCNEKSFSNAEIISHAFKTLERGTLVGQETYGGVISTGGARLIDGTFVRNPFRGWYTMEGVDMEARGAVPDILVPQTPEAEARGEDEQLRVAVDDLMLRLD